MRWSNRRLCLLLGAISVLSTTAVAASEDVPPPSETPEQTALVLEESQRSAEATALVSEALDILRTLDAAPVFQRKAETRSRGWIGSVLYYARQLLLWHQPESLEEPAGGVKREVTMGPKLRSAVGKLEAAKELDRNSDAIFLLAEMNFFGYWAHPRDYERAFAQYKDLADRTGNATAQSMVGFIYATGIGGAAERDQAKALLYHTFAALNGDTRSEMTVAFRHYTGIGAPRHCDEAAFYYKRVAEKAIQWWESGPPGGHHMQKHTYRLADDEGGVYGEGASAISSGLNALRQRQSLDSAKELEDIIEYLELLARKGNLAETSSLGKLYYEGSRNLPRNVARARSYFLKVAKQYWRSDGKKKEGGPPQLEKYAARAAGFLGTMALRGEGVKQDFVQAGEWFKRGRELGDANSYNGLGYMYLHGMGVKPNRQLAAEQFKLATEQDLPSAQVNLAKLLLENGEIEIAKRYFELAARHGHIEAYYYLAEINNSGVAKERSCGLATAYYKIVAERVEDLQSPLEWANLAIEDGDVESALIGYMMAAEQGYESGQANVAYLLDDHNSALSLKKLVRKPTARDRRADELALIYWTRSAKQANTDSLVKMGDYYLSGIGTELDPEKAASCYQAASELQASAQALWNLGWMHENGIGVEQDFHLAKRMYDLALETNSEAYLPVTLSLLKLRVRSFWNTITNGGVNTIGPDSHKKPRPTLKEFLKNWYQAAREADNDIYDEIPEEEMETHGHIPGDEFYEEFEDDLIESVVILVLAAMVAVLVYYRQQRQQGLQRRRQEEQRRLLQQQGVAVPPPAQPQPPAGNGGDQVPLGRLGEGNGLEAWGMPH